MVELALALAVVLDGLAAILVRDDVIDLAALGGDIAGAVGALPVTDFDGSPGGAGEEPLAHADVEDPAGPVEHDPFDVGIGEQREDLAGG